MNCLAIHLLSSDLLLVYFLVVKKLKEIFDQPLLAIQAVNVLLWYDIENLVVESAIAVLVVDVMIRIGGAHHTLSIYRAEVRHNSQIVQIHQEA